ncbi:heavy-metal-associated domain-containing protein [Halosegnis longus]|uniref:Heavy-metal-associated domain-containing protein n=1 Tax=Halosegnis longus TaxID=2216012 RepID=A0AAJ4R8E5_9EURY|nr:MULTISPECIES: cation transporter [Halobacteriales]RNJ26110.1 heavy-metal-associated domain-containing protein [Salella cibi]
MTKTLTVDGMSCDHCEQTVEDAVTAVEGVASARADETTETLEIEGDPDLAAVRTAIADAGYEPA